ncbi:hypothetical protein [Ancylobacter sp. TS-1]|uniref:hypothetical protein n=1 Tax=Ancylobacter sp. TS-1 TaxID=1850374 RepID=UPI001265D0A5|nr:hypothetical protein [Ancylobacter sp. TS-1]QFR33828.1 hypothetical protein GBB76_12290 [Ancylobacter sp. TS-1]
MHSTAIVSILAVMVGACSPIDKKVELSGISAGAARMAGPGDTVMDFRVTKPLPNAFGQADIFGRTTNAGKVSVRYLGNQDGRAVFERSDVSVESNATTMNQTPMMIPQTSETRVSGMVGGTPVSGNATSTSYSYVGPRPTTSYATASRPLGIALRPGESVSIEGRSLTVIGIAGSSVEYRID